MQLTESLRQQFEPALQGEIESRGKLVSARAGEIIIDYGKAVRVIPVLLKGTLKISRLDKDGNELLLYYVNPGESCALTFTCCMQHFPSEIRASAETGLEYWAIPIGVMDQWMVKYPSWKSYVMQTIRMRFNELMNAIDQLAFQKLDERLVQFLKEKSKVMGSSLINLSHEEIATEMASSREVISRLLKKLENDGRVLLYRNQIKIMPSL